MNLPAAARPAPDRLLAPEKFRDPDVTATGDRRAAVAFQALETLWFNTGTLCNLTCDNCYIDSSPRNDRLVYLRLDEVVAYLDEIAALGWPTQEIGFTGGEPFMNPEFMAMLEAALDRGYRVLVLSNAMRPMMKRAEALLALRERAGDRLVVRVSVDHYGKDLHEFERGARSWQPTVDGLCWLARHGFAVRVAGRTRWHEPEDALRRGYQRLFEELAVPVDAWDPVALVLFPEMDARLDVPEITEQCWGLLDVDPAGVMCATSRMVVKRKGAAAPAVVACTLVPYDTRFEMGQRLQDGERDVKLNHPHCARFCVLGGGSCSAPGG
jgi:uncharacterized Fe-S cluster-containing radical SAM superfamily protein